MLKYIYMEHDDTLYIAIVVYLQKIKYILRIADVSDLVALTKFSKDLVSTRAWVQISEWVHAKLISISRIGFIDILVKLVQVVT